jgi:type I restriction enzyme, S subunit
VTNVLQDPKKDGISASSTWKIARVGEILKIRNGYAFKSTDYKQEGTALIRQSELRADVVDLSDVKRVDPKFLQELPGFIIRKGDLLIGMSGSLGKIAEYQEDELALQNQRTGLLLIKEGYDSKFAKLVLKLVEPQIVAEGKGVAVQNVSAKEIEDCKFPLPPLDEQRAIVAEIEKQFTRLEAGVEAMKRLQANLKRYRAAVLKAACEGKLVPTEVELAKAEGRSYDTGEQFLQRILTERRKNWKGRGKYKEPAAPDATNLQELPEGWVWATVEQLADKVQYGHTASAIQRSSGVRFLRITDIQDRHVEWDSVPSCDISPSDLDALLLLPGDLVFARTGATVGKSFLLKAPFPESVFASYLIRIRPAGDYLSRWLHAFFQSPDYWKQIRDSSVGIGQPNVNGTKLQALRLPLPPLAEQSRIVEELECRLSVIEELEATVSTNLQRATHLRQSILQKAFK